MSDILRTYPVTEVAAWYRRLANRIGQERINGQEPLSAQFLRHYVDNRDPDSTYSPAPPSYLSNNSLVLEALRYHRRVFIAPPWPEIYVNDPERRHGFDDAVLEHDRLGCVDIQRSQIIAAARQSIEKKLHAVFSKRVAMRR